MTNRTIILNQEDVNNPLHPHLWTSFMDTLGLEPETTEVCLERSELDENKVIDAPLFKKQDRVSLANNTTLVCGTIEVSDSIGSRNRYFVVWDDNLYYGRPTIEGWYEEDELEKV